MKQRRNSGPIGIFDSGIGGLTVLRAIKKRMPDQSLIYFGDTAHVPYGSKSKEAVTHFSMMIGKFLVERGAKLLVIACNTASALALPELKKSLGIPVIGVLMPGARAARAVTRRRRVGIIATEATIASQAYQRALKLLVKDVKITAVACPLFVPLVEEGWWNRPVTRRIAEEYLRPLKQAGIDTLILGCTHYPLLKPVLRKVMGSRVRMVDSAEAIAQAVYDLRKRQDLAQGRVLARPLSRRSKKVEDLYFCSDGPDRFLRMARRLLGVHIRKVSIHSLD